MGPVKTNKQISKPASIALGIAMSVGVTMLGSLVLAWFVSKETLPEENLKYAVMLVTIASSVIGGLVATARAKERKLLISVLSGVGYYIVLLACTALFFEGQYSGLGLTGLLVLLGSVIVGIFKNRGRTATGNRRHKVPNR